MANEVRPCMTVFLYCFTLLLCLGLIRATTLTALLISPDRNESPLFTWRRPPTTLVRDFLFPFFFLSNIPLTPFLREGGRKELFMDPWMGFQTRCLFFFWEVGGFGVSYHWVDHGAHTVRFTKRLFLSLMGEGGS
ncbi:hypothetical protein BS50DRAFT_322887 [Corynespora cassiicola Philippines]|uniref:Uncharacterized protein n=1 Tax=Corynespora cassiicola Philippines TaxID=1448308 RepID=A0A2T2NTG0_CORCC|nr:hypothetical protein BS50DRAFT_322887 [Corynespora cassiicola Philippines]